LEEIHAKSEVSIDNERVSIYVMGKMKASYTIQFKLKVMLHADEMESELLHDNLMWSQNMYAHDATTNNSPFRKNFSW
jgi:hypothetical protein